MVRPLLWKGQPCSDDVYLQSETDLTVRFQVHSKPKVPAAR